MPRPSRKRKQNSPHVAFEACQDDGTEEGRERGREELFAPPLRPGAEDVHEYIRPAIWRPLAVRTERRERGREEKRGYLPQRFAQRSGGKGRFFHGRCVTPNSSGKGERGKDAAIRHVHDPESREHLRPPRSAACRGRGGKKSVPDCPWPLGEKRSLGANDLRHLQKRKESRPGRWSRRKLKKKGIERGVIALAKKGGGKRAPPLRPPRGKCRRLLPERTETVFPSRSDTNKKRGGEGAPARMQLHDEEKKDSLRARDPGTEGKKGKASCGFPPGEAHADCTRDSSLGGREESLVPGTHAFWRRASHSSTTSRRRQGGKSEPVLGPDVANCRKKGSPLERGTTQERGAEAAASIKGDGELWPPKRERKARRLAYFKVRKAAPQRHPRG